MPRQIRSNLLPLVQRGVRQLPYSFPRGLSVAITSVEADSPTVDHVTVHMTAYFTPRPQGHCCGEPSCYSRFFWPEAKEAIGRYMRRKLRLDHPVVVDFDVTVDYDPKIVFDYRMLSIRRLSPEDRGVIRACLVALLDWPLLSEPEFRARLGFSKEFLAEVIATWKTLVTLDRGSDVATLVHNVLNEVGSGIHLSDEEWNRCFPVDRETVRWVYVAWRRFLGR
jgi:hypothetical protein